MKDHKNSEFNFLHNHPITEKVLGVDSDHVIVDKGDWMDVRSKSFISKVEFKKIIAEMQIDCDSTGYAAAENYLSIYIEKLKKLMEVK